MPKNVIILAGPNGAGKTSFANQYVDISSYQYLSADAIAEKLTPQSFNDVKVQAGREFFKQITDMISENQNIVVESTLSGLGFQRIIHRFNQAGYRITILFIYLGTPEVCIKRVKERVLKGGHDVPEVDIQRRFYRSKKNFWNIYKKQAHYWHLFYNANDGFIEVGVGKETQLTITDEVLFKIFLPDINNMNNNQVTDIQAFIQAAEFKRIGNRAVHKALEENRQLGIPSVFSRNGKLYYELPNGEITTEDPFKEINLNNDV